MRRQCSRLLWLTATHAVALLTGTFGALGNDRLLCSFACALRPPQSQAYVAAFPRRLRRWATEDVDMALQGQTEPPVAPTTNRHSVRVIDICGVPKATYSVKANRASTCRTMQRIGLFVEPTLVARNSGQRQNSSGRNVVEPRYRRLPQALTICLQTTQPMSDSTLWGIHAGKTGDADTLFLQRNHIGIGWHVVGDLSRFAADREDFKRALAQAYPQKKQGAIPVDAGQLYRFVHEMRVGDLVAYPSKRDRQIHIGRVTGDYRYDLTFDPGYPNLRPVTWLKGVPRTQFRQGALYEIGSAMSLFQIRNYADEFLAVLDERPQPPPVDEDETVADVLEDIEETTSDFILKTLGQELKGHPFAAFVAHLLNTMGYQTRVSPEGPDGGVDIIAHRDELGFEPPIIKVQVKSSEGSIGDPAVSSLYGKVGSNEHGLLVTLGTFTPAAKTFARSKSNLRLVDGEELIRMITSHYEQFDSKYKGILPLKRVYVPESRVGESNS